MCFNSSRKLYRIRNIESIEVSQINNRGKKSTTWSHTESRGYEQFRSVLFYEGYFYQYYIVRFKPRIFRWVGSHYKSYCKNIIVAGKKKDQYNSFDQAFSLFSQSSPNCDSIRTHIWFVH